MTPERIEAFSIAVLELLGPDAAVAALFLATFIVSGLAATIVLVLLRGGRCE